MPRKKEKGNRNNRLHQVAKSFGPHLSERDLLARLLRYNSRFINPLPREEVVKVASSWADQKERVYVIVNDEKEILAVAYTPEDAEHAQSKYPGIIQEHEVYVR